MKTMKFFSMMLCIATLGFNVLCSTEYEDLIIGKWKCVSGSNEHVNPETHELVIENSEEAAGMAFEFTEDGKVTIWGVGTETYSISGNTLYIGEGSDLIELEIRNLTRKKMTLCSTYELYCQDANDPTVFITVENYSIMNFEKQ